MVERVNLFEFLKPRLSIIIADTKVYPSGEVTPYGINAIHALNVPDIYAKNIKVCIVDSGYDVNHPDLPSAATGGTITGSNNGNAPWNVDGFGHGTHVAGTIAAIGGNGQGVVGILRNGEANLHIIRVFGDDQGWVWKSHIVNAVSTHLWNVLVFILSHCEEAINIHYVHVMTIKLTLVVHDRSTSALRVAPRLLI